MLTINEQTLANFQRIKELYLPNTKVPKRDNWQEWTDNDIWLHLVSQVIVIGKSLPAEKFEKSDELQKKRNIPNSESYLL